VILPPADGIAGGKEAEYTIVCKRSIEHADSLMFERMCVDRVSPALLHSAADLYMFWSEVDLEAAV
jgi:hypothetical protein